MKLFRTIAVLMFSGSLCPHLPAQSPAKPNILFIFADDWGFGDVGVYGNKQISTPNLDEFAKKSKRFTRFHVTSGVCSPSRVSVITGHFPARYRVHGHFAANELNEKRAMPNWLPDTISVTLPRLLKNAGYNTAHFGKWHLGGGGLPHGDLSAPVPTAYGYDEARVWNGNGPTWKGTEYWDQTRYADEDTVWNQHAASLAVDATLDFITRKSFTRQPFFVNLWLKEPHAPLIPSEAQREKFRQVPEPEQTYYALIHEADKQIGRLLKTLEQKGLLENTLVIFSSDNGPESPTVAKGAAGTSGNYRGGKRSLYEGGICVPFMVYWKGKVQPGAVDSTTILSSADLFPTFCKLAGAAWPAYYKPDGENIAAAFTDNDFRRTAPLFWQWNFSNPQHATYWMDGAVLEGDWKLVQNSKTTRTELYNIVADPFEKHDVANENKEVIVRLQDHWQQWKQTLPGQ